LDRRLQLTFDPEIPAFTIQESEPDSELYSSLFRVLPDVDGEAIAGLREELEQGNFHPVGEEDTNGFLKRLVHTLSSEGQYEEEPVDGEKDYPRLVREPTLYLRQRVLGFATAIEGVLDRIEENEPPPRPLQDVAGVQQASGDGEQEEKASEAPELLLSKPANKEQRRVAERLERHGAVVVQGPPGTGKTHTIANLMGHLLARGKKILVTSHTSKALRRVREQVVEPLRSLCVSALGADAQSRSELEQAVSQMASRLGEYDANELGQEASRLKAQRAGLKDDLAEKKAKLRRARRSEYEKIVVGGEEFHPTEAAKKVEREREEHGWIPGPVEEGAPLPLSEENLAELYATNRKVSAEEEEELRGGLPGIDSIPSPTDFEDFLDEKRDLAQRELDRGNEYWKDPSSSSIEQIEELRQDLREVLSPLDGADPWQLDILEAGRKGRGRKEVWEDLLMLIEQTATFADEYEPYRIAHNPRLSDDKPVPKQSEIVGQIVRRLDEGKSLNTWILMWHSEWKECINSWSTNGSSPETLEEFQALKKKAELERLRSQLTGYWSRLVASEGGLGVNELGPEPEETLRQYRQPIMLHLGWYEKRFKPLRERIQDAGLDWDALLEDASPIPGRRGRLRRLKRVGRQALDFLKAQENRLRNGQLQSWKAQRQKELKEKAENCDGNIVVDLHITFRREDLPAYREAYHTFEGLHELDHFMQRRRTLLNKVEAAAPQWAAQIRERVPPHNADTLPGNPKTAWRWRQLNDELDRRATDSVDAIQREIETLETELLTTTQRLIEKQAWKAQIRRIEADQSRRQALVGWADTQRKIGKGYGKNVPKLRRKAREQMKKSREAVPAWIMPLTGAVENFDARTTQFDVAIVDEASQVDVKGLLLMYLAEQVVVVGDHKQVSPSAVGEKIEEVNYLIEEHLQGIPNNHLYDGKTSIYDLARQSFGGTIGLREHFRCVPEIIQFSNALAYDFEIKPLRDASTADLEPHVVAHRVQGATYEQKLNEKEAVRVASLVAAATEDPAYEEKSIGVVSLVGEKQAERIEELLRTHLDPVVYEQDHQILTGNPAQFQGDERDVMFLSVVDAPGKDDGPLRKRTQKLFRQRFNVAASRARDQMWVIHSLDPKAHLKEGDLRRRLIEHAQDPTALTELAESEERKTESPFEKKVLRRLREEGYRVKPQWEVGAYRIDLVVVGSDETKLAVECDGERYHPPEKLEEDMERQAILERLGWTFVRIRGSVFFRDPDEALEPVFDRIDEMGIDRAGRGESPTGEDSTSELKDRIVRRAAELRREWEGTEEELQEWSEETTGDQERHTASKARDPSSHKTDSREDPSANRTRDKNESLGGSRDLFESIADGDNQETNIKSEEKKPVKPDVGEYDQPEDIPDSELFTVLHYHIPKSEAVKRKPLLKKVAAEFGFVVYPNESDRPNNTDLRSRLNKYISQQIRGGKLEEINGWEKVRRVT
jgi:very-short-patch-repair endonuclease